MCGIAGQLYLTNASASIQRSVVTTMLNTIQHRGPDSSSTYHEEGVLSMGAVRLSMVDSEVNTVIFGNRNNSIHLVYNGEIYNHVALREELSRGGYKFATRNDGEVIIGLYEKYGNDFLNLLDGMFAFVLWDQEKQTLLMARDHIGIKPLYYARVDNTLVFASEAKAIVSAYPSLASISEGSVADYVKYRFIPAPKSIYSNVHKVEPGTYVVVNNTEISKHTYWKPTFNNSGEASGFENIFKTAVETSISDEHKIGIFLSGGLDSSAVVSVRAEKEKYIDTFTVGYDTKGYEDEGYYARILSDEFKTLHHYKKIKDDEISQILTRSIWHLDEPLYSTVGVSNYVLAETAARTVKGVMTGDGSDELLMGYPYLIAALEALKEGGDWKSTYESQIGWIDDKWANRILPKELSEKAEVLIDGDSRYPLDEMRYFELRYRLPEYHLTRMDRLTMAHGLEARVPFLRRNLVDWCSNQTSEALLVPGLQKLILKQSQEHRLPDAILNRRKQPFTAPYRRWLEGPLKRELYEIMLGSGYHRNFSMKRAGLEALINESYDNDTELLSVVWGFYVLFKWYDAYKG